MPVQKAMTSIVEFLLVRGTKADAVAKANEYCMMTPCHRIKYRKMPKTGGQDAIAELQRELVTEGGKKSAQNTWDIWLIAIEQRVPSQADVILGLETVQTYVVEVTDGNFDTLKRLVNEFALQNIVIKHDILWDPRDPKNWVVMITYAVKYQ